MSRDTWMEEGTATHSRILAWEIPWTEEPGGLQSTESQKSWIWLNDYITTTYTHTHTYIYIYMSLCIITESICCIPKTLWINYIWIKYNLKKRDTWNNRQVWPLSTKWNRAKANSFAKRMHWTEHAGLSTTQERTVHMDITRWSTLKSDCLYSLQPKMEKLYTVSINKTWSWLWLRSWTPYCNFTC